MFLHPSPWTAPKPRGEALRTPGMNARYRFTHLKSRLQNADNRQEARH
jgi:hypothetical protein